MVEPRIPRLSPWGAVKIEIQPMEAMLLIQIINSCEIGANMDGFASWKVFSSRKKKDRTGVGLQSVVEIAEKYNGSAQFQQKDGKFITRVALCMLSGEDETGEQK